MNTYYVKSDELFDKTVSRKIESESIDCEEEIKMKKSEVKRKFSNDVKELMFHVKFLIL